VPVEKAENRALALLLDIQVRWLPQAPPVLQPDGAYELISYVRTCFHLLPLP
jgi:hypothetical protein